MLRVRWSGIVLALLFACARKEDPEPLASYGSARLAVSRAVDARGTPIVHAYLFPDDDDDCPPLARVKATIDGRTLMAFPGGDRGTCFGAAFKAPLVVLSTETDFHDLSITDDTKTIRARIADLRSDARLEARQDGDVLRLRFDHDVRGRIESAKVVWSGTVPGDVARDGDEILARVPDDVRAPGRIVVEVDAFIDLDVAACDGIAECRATWFLHEVLDVSLTR